MMLVATTLGQMSLASTFGCRHSAWATLVCTCLTTKLVTSSIQCTAWTDGMKRPQASRTTLTLRAFTVLVSLVLVVPPSWLELLLAQTQKCACPFRTFQLLLR